MAQRKLTEQEVAEQDERRKLCRRFLNTIEGVGWMLLILTVVFILKHYGLLPVP
ncbi:hypothetical protein [Acinetobacter phage vB_AbaS_TCUP2199]|nr:hypothetical protein [Acinetobacter phage vB_AbaS_TCUP2199]